MVASFVPGQRLIEAFCCLIGQGMLSHALWTRRETLKGRQRQGEAVEQGWLRLVKMRRSSQDDDVVELAN